jgi:hypothetical protein
MEIDTAANFFDTAPVSQCVLDNFFLECAGHDDSVRLAHAGARECPHSRTE